MGLLDDIAQYGLLGGGAGLLGINPAAGALAGNAARGALAGGLAPPGVKGFWGRLSYGAGAGEQAVAAHQQQMLRQRLGYQQLQTGQLEQQAAARQNRLGTITENYYRRQNGLPELPADGSGGMPPAASTSPTQGDPSPVAPTTGAPGGAAPGVPAAAAPLSQVSQGSDEWWQALYRQGQGMLGVPGMANDGVTLMEKAKAHDPSVLQTEAYAKAVGEAQGKPIELSRPGASLRQFNPQTGQYDVVAENPIQVPGRDAAGNPTSSFVYPPTRPGGQAGPAAAAPGPAAAPQQGGQGGATNGIENIYDLADTFYKLPPGSMRTIAGMETSGSKDSGPGSVSPVGATGRMQVMPNTVAPGVDLHNPFQNVPAGAQRLAEYQQRYAKYVTPQAPEAAQWLGAAAYNWGPGNVDKWLASGYKPGAIPQGVVDYANKYVTGIASGPQAQTAQVPAPATSPGAVPQPSGAFQTGLGPQATQEFEGQGKRFNEMRDGADKDGTAAVQHLAILDEMNAASQGFRMGAGANITATAQAWGKYLGITSDQANAQLADYEQMRKQAITAGSSAITSVSNREAVQGQKMIWAAQPNPGMSPQGFRQVVDSLAAVDDYKIAKQQWARSQPLGTNIDAEWNARVSPNAFWVHRMSTDDLKTVTAKLAQTQQGRTLLGNLSDQMKWAQQNGLMDQ